MSRRPRASSKRCFWMLLRRKTASESPVILTPFASALSKFFDRLSEDLSGVEGGAGGAVVDLVAATGAWGGDEDFGRLFADDGEEDEFADVHRDVVVFLFVAE